MIGIISGYVLIVIALLAIVLQRLYSSVPARELKRLAQKGDHLAKSLYRPVAYGSSLRLLLWTIMGVSMSAGLLIVLPHLPPLAGFVLLAVVMVISFVWAPSMLLTVHTARFAGFVAPALVKVLYYVHTPFDYASSQLGRVRDLPRHSRLYEKQDLQELLKMQEEQIDNRILQDELKLASRALDFDEKHASDVAKPRREAHLVDADETISAVFLDQLHKNGQSSFLVYKDSKDNIIGSLAMRDAVTAKKGGRVFDLVRGDLTFVHEDFTLRQVLGAFQKTGHNVAVVVNSFEEFLGVVSLDAIIKELFGDPAADIVDNYESRGSVAAYEPKQPEEPTPELQEEPAVQEESTSPEATEVVE